MDLIKKLLGWILVTINSFFIMFLMLTAILETPFAIILVILFIPFLVIGFKLVNKNPLAPFLNKLHKFYSLIKKGFNEEKEKALIKENAELNDLKRELEVKKRKALNSFTNWEREKDIQRILLLLKIRQHILLLEEISNSISTNKKIYYVEMLDSAINEKEKILKNRKNDLVKVNNSIDKLNEELDTVSSKYKKRKQYFTVIGEIIYDREISMLDSIDGIEFEKYIAYLFKYLGYTNIIRTQDTNDQGLDVIAEKNGEKVGIQCKLYSSPVGNFAVQQVIAGKTFYKLDKAMVITNNFFTDSAMKLAFGTDVILMDKGKLNKLIHEIACSGEYLPYNNDCH
ncbi:restriction endonuclease [Ligilactobacillus sp. WILCCON 0076]|uniref:Restriction endonuclease n=1 Tax=Ligilactobacillus ubinensis TaxID=2876789 RepID=A0A9X2FMJ4_9LACO|nr:restriction endonuclease [Ligilactobacillus ubinensis]MCP0886968.1 restriction endonuclease [Ligilactobacillus ubinensis]